MLSADGIHQSDQNSPGLLAPIRDWNAVFAQLLDALDGRARYLVDRALVDRIGTSPLGTLGRDGI